MAKKYDYETAVYVDPFPGREDTEIAEVRHCGRCGGSGELYCYRHIDGGRCFECLGTGGRHEVTVGTMRREAKAATKSENTRRRETAKRRAARAARLAEYSEAFPIWSRATESRNSIVCDMMLRAFKYDLSDKQVAFGAKLLTEEFDVEGRAARAKAKAEAEAAAIESAGPMVEGRREIRAVIRSIKWEDNNFAYNGASVAKGLLVEASGHKLYGTIPAALLEGEIDDLVGAEVVMTATVKVSDRDPLFGFISRPSKARRA